jgi:hypothetical protein
MLLVMMVHLPAIVLHYKAVASFTIVISSSIIWPYLILRIEFVDFINF